MRKPIASMVVAFVTNDSGVVMAATGLLYLALPLILVVESARGKKSDPLCNTAEILKK